MALKLLDKMRLCNVEVIPEIAGICCSGLPGGFRRKLVKQWHGSRNAPLTVSPRRRPARRSYGMTICAALAFAFKRADAASSLCHNASGDDVAGEPGASWSANTAR